MNDVRLEGVHAIYRWTLYRDKHRSGGTAAVRISGTESGRSARAV